MRAKLENLQFTCSNGCGLANIKYKDYIDHLQRNCPALIVKCPLNCDSAKTYPRPELDAHFLVCPMTKVTC